MKIGILSDTHGSLVQTQRALAHFQDCDYIIHLGDVLYHGPRNPIYANYDPAGLADYLKDYDQPIEYIRGNCDADVDEMVTEQDLSHKEKVLELGDLTLYLVHGYEESLDERIARARELDADVLCFGHSHVKVLEEREGLTILNPGSTTLPKDGSCSIAKYEDGQWELIELANSLEE